MTLVFLVLCSSCVGLFIQLAILCFVVALTTGQVESDEWADNRGPLRSQQGLERFEQDEVLMPPSRHWGRHPEGCLVLEVVEGVPDRECRLVLWDV